MSVNKAILIGRLGKDPDLRYTPNGTAVASFTLATNERWTNQEGQSNERTTWHNIVVWGKQAELAKEYLRKGRQALRFRGCGSEHAVSRQPGRGCAGVCFGAGRGCRA